MCLYVFIYIYIYRRANGIYIQKSCNIWTVCPCFYFLLVTILELKRLITIASIRLTKNSFGLQNVHSLRSKHVSGFVSRQGFGSGCFSNVGSGFLKVVSG